MRSTNLLGNRFVAHDTQKPDATLSRRGSFSPRDRKEQQPGQASATSVEPPQQKPIGSYIASIREIVAIKTVWVEEGAEVEGPEPTTRHLDFIIQGIAAQASSLGILKVKVLPTGPMRVDLVTGTLIARQQGITEEFASVIAAPSKDDRSAPSRANAACRRYWVAKE